MVFLSKRRMGLVSGLLASLLLVGVASSLAQDLGEAARRERARKRNQRPRAAHVYTEQDLARPEILLPEDRARAEAARQKLTAPRGEQAAEIPGAVAKPAEIPLGDIARHYRLLKQIREKQELGQAPPFIGPPPLASPEFSKLPLVAPPVSNSDFSEVESTGAELTNRRNIEAFDRVRAQRGDSLWKLAKRHLGRGARWGELAAINPQITDPAVIHVGEWIRLPLQVTSQQSAKQFRVHKGDSLWKVAQAEFGNGLAWNCIAQANPQIQNADVIYPGQMLAIPARCTAAP